MIEDRQGQEVPTTLQAGDLIHYSQEYEWVKFVRGMRALRYSNGDDKELLFLQNHADFKSLCAVVAHACGLSIFGLPAVAPPLLEENIAHEKSYGGQPSCTVNDIASLRHVLRGYGRQLSS